MLRLRGIAISASVLATAVGCTELESGLDYCNLVEDCTIEEPDPQGNEVIDREWGCLDPDAPRPPNLTPIPDNPPDFVALTFAVVDPTTLQPVPGLTLRLCTNADPSCSRDFSAENPAQLIDPVRGGYSMVVPFSTEARFTLKLQAPGYTNLDFNLGDELDLNLGNRRQVPLPGGGTIEVEVFYADVIFMPSSENYASYFPDFGTAPETPGSGITAVRVYDCMGEFVAGAQIPVQEPEKLRLESTNLLSFAFANGIPAQGSDVAVTSAQGIAGYANVNTGAVTLSAISPLPTNIEFATTNLRVAERTISVVDMRPPNPYARHLPPE